MSNIKYPVEPPKVEEDIPKDNVKFNISRDNEPKHNDRDWLNTIKGHNLLGWCVALFVLLYILESWLHGGKVSEIGKTIIEILKILTFSLTGYLFGTSSQKKE